MPSLPGLGGSTGIAATDGWAMGYCMLLIPAVFLGLARLNAVLHNKRFLHGTNPNSVENKASLEERTQTNPLMEAKQCGESVDFIEDTKNFEATRVRCTNQMR
jgi:hypothetical protein